MLCESLYASLQILEVGVRNAMHQAVGKNFNDLTWLKNENAFLQPQERKTVQEAKQSLNSRRVFQGEPELVAEMSFGFWTSLLDTRYDALWHRITTTTFPHAPRPYRTRSEISKRMNAARRLRNAAFHHHSIWHWSDLGSQHGGIRELIKWISPSLNELAFTIDRFPRIFRQGRRECARIAGPPCEYEI